MDPETYISPAWPGWRVTWLADTYEAHLAKLGNRVTLPGWTTEHLLARVESSVMNSSSAAPSAATLKAMFRDSQVGGLKTDLDPQVQIDRQLELLPELRKQIFDRAVSGWRCAAREENGP